MLLVRCAGCSNFPILLVDDWSEKIQGVAIDCKTTSNDYVILFLNGSLGDVEGAPAWILVLTAYCTCNTLSLL